MRVRLGPFLLERPIARGGMAEVWRGVHERDDVPVAIKVLMGAHARDDAFVRALNNEIHAVARLDHPGIIVLYDRGTVTDDAAGSSGGRLVAGSPWVAMEMCSYGALSPRRFPLPWSTTKTLLLALLDALAHAHARGVVHRDLKPGNILLCAPDDTRSGLKLSDFGIAQPLGLVDDDAGAGRAHAWSGTPRYMAPEQFNGVSRELGPWTDLYALGCLAFQLACGQAPFSGDPLRLAVAHCHDVVPAALGDVEGYPTGYEAWVLRLLEKRPRDRFTTAADAAWALQRLSVDAADLADDWDAVLRALHPRSLFAEDQVLDETHANAERRDAPQKRSLDLPSLHSLSSLSSLSLPTTQTRDDTTGPMVAPVYGSIDTARAQASAAYREAPTAIFRRLPATPLPPPILDVAPAGAIADDDPFALALREPSMVRASEEPTMAGPLPSSTTGVAIPRLDDDHRPRASAAVVPVPATWRRSDGADDLAQRTRLHLLGAGLGLYGLRRVPFVDRLVERDRLWAQLTSAAPHHRVVVVHGAAGIGRSRLLAWFGERAAELGAATVVRAGHGPGGGPLDGLAGALARAVRLPMRGDIAAALAGGFMKAALPQLNDDDGRLLARVLMGTDDGDVERRDDVVLRALSALSCGRRSVVILDDAHLGDDALAFAQRLLARPSTTTEAVVVVLAVADEALVERAHAHAAVIDLERDPRVQSLSLRPLLPADHRRLVEDLLGLEPGLADVVAARTAGNPRFAVELVGDFVERGVLELAPSGFALRRGEPATLPDTVHAAWSTRLLRLLSTLPGDARHCLELGAVLGADGDTAAWIAVCEAAGIDSARDVVERLVDALERARFVVVDPPGSARFTHAMLRESMLRLADDGGRLLQHHRSVASWLSTRPGHRKQERRARHLLLAGDLDDAVPVLCTAASSALLTDGPSRAMQLVDELFSALDNAGVADVDPRRLRAVALRARVLAAAGRYDESAMWAGLVDDNAPLLAQLDGLRARALTAQRRGEHDLAAELFQSMLVLADDDSATPAHVAGEADAVDEALLGLADGLYRQGRLDDAAAVFGRALLRASWRADDEAVASCLWSLSTVSLWRGNPAMARALVLRAQKVARRAGLRTLTAFGRSALGDVERIAGEPAEARHHYVEAARQLAGAGSARLRAVELNLALCDIADDNHAAAGERASRLLGVLDAAGEGALSSLCHGVLALTSARASDWSAADAHLAVFLTPWSQGVVDGEHALLAEAFARVAIQQGDVWRAVVANSCAREVWTSLGRQDRIDALPVV